MSLPLVPGDDGFLDPLSDYPNTKAEAVGLIRGCLDPAPPLEHARGWGSHGDSAVLEVSCNGYLRQKW